MLKYLILLLTFFAATAQSDSDRRLDVWYAAFNHQYFADELPKQVIISRNLTDNRFMALTFYENGYYHIAINPRYNISTKTERINLLHESCHIQIFVEHAEEFDDHGPHWQSCMHKLADAGAFEQLW